MDLPVGTWLAQARGLADREELAELRGQLDDLAKAQSRPTFRVAFAGEASSGKTALVTQLQESFVDSLALEIVDTPALNRTREDDRSASFTAAGSDLLVMLTPAMAPLSQTEVAFLSDVQSAGQLSHVVLMLARLDLVDESEQEAAVAAVRQRAQATFEGIEVLIAPHGAAEGDLEVLRQLMFDRGTADDRGAQRDRQVAWRLMAHAGRMVELGRQAVRVAELSEQERQAEAQRTARQAGEDETRWLELREGLADRRLAAANELARQLAPAKEAIAGELRDALRSAPDPVVWFETRLADHLGRCLQSAAKEHNEWLANRISLDLAWLDLRVSEIVADAPTLEVETGAPPGVAEVPAHPMAHTDLQRAKLLYRYAPPGVAFVGTLLVPGVGPGLAIIAAGAAFMIGDHKYRGLVKEQAEAVKKAVTQVTDQAVDDLVDQASGRVGDIYRQAADGVAALNLAWRRDRSAVTAVAANGSDAGKWQDLIRDADRLRLSIAQALQANPAN